MDEQLVALARTVIEAHSAAGTRVAVAESCTGGLTMAALTAVPGSSAVLEGGVVSYSDEAKVSLLGVSEDIVSTFGAVSKAAAWAMARGALLRTDADVAVSITGIAGPSGGSAAKPVGTVIFARAHRGDDEEAAHTFKREFDPALGRDGIRTQAALAALELLLPPSEGEP